MSIDWEYPDAMAWGCGVAVVEKDVGSSKDRTEEDDDDVMESRQAEFGMCCPSLFFAHVFCCCMFTGIAGC
jgi:hypothetical protein